MKKPFSQGRMEHEKRLMEIARESISQNHKRQNSNGVGQRVDDIKVGQTVFIREVISEGPGDYSPGGIYAQRGDAVLVEDIRIGKADVHVSDDLCLLKYIYSVRHFDVSEGAFIVYRNEVTTIDPLLTIKDQREYFISRGGRFKTLDDRFKDVRVKCQS